MKRTLLIRSPRWSTREEYCISLSALLTLNQRKRAYALLRKGLSQRSLSGLFCTELLLQLSLLLGVPLMLEGLEYLQSLRKRTVGRPGAISSRGAFRKGTSALKSVYGDQAEKLLQRLDDLHPGLGRRICEDGYGQILSRTGLSFREREFINITVLFVQRYDAQLYSHLRGATRAGVDPRTLETLVRLLARSTRRPSASALAMLGTIAGPDRT
ncbi:MAG: carboxymuconolactone decarboxylase family protein [Bacteroidota bacterium]